ncbi:hypothetical protein V7201_13585 [Bacillus sp. JJ1122]
MIPQLFIEIPQGTLLIPQLFIEIPQGTLLITQLFVEIPQVTSSIPQILVEIPRTGKNLCFFPTLKGEASRFSSYLDTYPLFKKYKSRKTTSLQK